MQKDSNETLNLEYAIQELRERASSIQYVTNKYGFPVDVLEMYQREASGISEAISILSKVVEDAKQTSKG